MHVHVDESRRNDLATKINDLCVIPCHDALADLFDPTLHDEDVNRLLSSRNGIDEPAALQKKFHVVPLLVGSPQEVEHRHANGDAVGDLLEND